jgi:hypothetical protein
MDHRVESAAYKLEIQGGDSVDSNSMGERELTILSLTLKSLGVAALRRGTLFLPKEFRGCVGISCNPLILFRADKRTPDHSSSGWAAHHRKKDFGGALGTYSDT